MEEREKESGSIGLMQCGGRIGAPRVHCEWVLNGYWHDVIGKREACSIRLLNDQRMDRNTDCERLKAKSRHYRTLA